MKTEKKLLIIVPGIFLIAFVLGAIGILRLPPESWAKQPEPEKRLIGVLITFRPLHDYDYTEEQVTDHLLANADENAASISDRIDERVFATLTAEEFPNYGTGNNGWKYVFEYVEGIPFFCPQYYNEDGSSYTYMTYNNLVKTDLLHCISYEADTPPSITLEGTLALTEEHFQKEGGSIDNCIIFFNPVYQDSNGAVYALPGQAMALSEYSDTTTYALNESTTRTDSYNTFSGDYESSETKENGSVTVHVKQMKPSAEINVAQYDTEMNLIKKEVYTPETIPDEYAVSPDASFLVVETAVPDAYGHMKTAQKELLSRGDTSANSIVYYTDRGDGVLILEGSMLKW